MACMQHAAKTDVTPRGALAASLDLSPLDAAKSVVVPEGPGEVVSAETIVGPGEVFPCAFCLEASFTHCAKCYSLLCLYHAQLPCSICYDGSDIESVNLPEVERTAGVGRTVHFADSAEFIGVAEDSEPEELDTLSSSFVVVTHPTL